MEITTATLLDHETQTSYSFSVQVTDGANSVTEALTLTINDVNDEPPACTPKVVTESINENTGLG